LNILIPLPDNDFDVTEVSVPWRLLSDKGYDVIFATEKGQTPRGDPRLLSGVIFGQLGAEPEPRRFYRELERAAPFRNPIAWDAVNPHDYAGLILPGGHAPGMRQYLGSGVLREKAAEFWSLERPVGAICHGVLVLARAKDPASNRSLIHDRDTTCLPKYMERSAHMLTRWKLGTYYRTYPEFVEDEVKRALDNPAAQFKRGPINLTRKGTRVDDRAAFVVQDRRYLSARWPGDAYLFAERFATLLSGSAIHAVQ